MYTFSYHKNPIYSLPHFSSIIYFGLPFVCSYILPIYKPITPKLNNIIVPMNNSNAPISKYAFAKIFVFLAKNDTINKSKPHKKLIMPIFTGIVSGKVENEVIAFKASFVSDLKLNFVVSPFLVSVSTIIFVFLKNNFSGGGTFRAGAVGEKALCLP